MSLKNNAPTASRGEITAEIGGQLRTFKFGMNAVASYGELHPAAGAEGFLSEFGTNPYRALIDMAYCGLVQRAAVNDLPKDFSPQTVGEWLDEMGQADWQRVQAVMMAALVPGKPATEARQTPA